jgi:dTDP-glucose pyrophosphorylase
MAKSSGAPDADEVRPWRRAVLFQDATLHQAVRNLNDSALQIALVTAADGTLMGTITDGDVRRGLLRGLDLTSPIDSVIKREAMVAPADMTRESALRLMQSNQITALPIIDDRRRLVGLHLLHEVTTASRRKNVMIIMAGGRGARLGPHTEKCPKPLLAVNGKPMLEHILERAKTQGFSAFIISVGYLGHMIEAYFGDGSRWNVEITYLREDHPLGTAGAIALLRPRPLEPFVVTNGDVLTDVDYSEMLDFHTRSGAAATMAVRLHEWQHPFGVVFTKGVDIVGFEEKPVSRTYVNAGIYVLGAGALDCLSEGEHCDMPTIFERLKDAGARTIVYPVHEAWMDLGRPEDFEAPHLNAGQ